MFSRASKRIAKRQAKLEKIFESSEQKMKDENISRGHGIKKRKELIASGEWEEVKSGLRKIQK